MSNRVRDPQLYTFDLEGRTYTVRFEYVHAYIVEREAEHPLMLYLTRRVPEALHVDFLKAVTYVRKEFALQ